MKIVPRSNKLEIAFITGEIPNLIIENICNGNVVAFGPATKKVMTKSSIESVNAMKKAAIIPGMAIGTITFLRTMDFVAPKSYAASIMVLSKSCKRVKIIIIVYGIENVTCATYTVKRLSWSLIVTKNISNETPMMMSGMTNGIYVVVHMSFLNLGLPRYIAIAPKVPIKTAVKLAVIPTIIELKNVRQTCRYLVDVNS